MISLVTGSRSGNGFHEQSTWSCLNVYYIGRGLIQLKDCRSAPRSIDVDLEVAELICKVLSCIISSNRDYEFACAEANSGSG